MPVKFNRDTLRGTTKTQGDFNLSNKFNLEIDAITIGGVNSVDGIAFEVEVVEYQDGDDMVTHYRPGRYKPGRISIERDWGSNPEFFNWRKAVVDGSVERKSMSVIFNSDDNVESKRINFFHCYPAKWHAPSLNSKQSGNATEKLEVLFETLEIK